MTEYDEATFIYTEENDLVEKMKSLSYCKYKGSNLNEKQEVITASKNILYSTKYNSEEILDKNMNNGLTRTFEISNKGKDQENNSKEGKEENSYKEEKPNSRNDLEENKEASKAPSNQIILEAHHFRHLVYSNSVSEEDFQKYILQIHRGLVYSRKCLRSPSEKYIESKRVIIQKPKMGFTKGQYKKKTLLLDLDETLIHSCQQDEVSEFVLRIEDTKNESILRVNVRPYCIQFLKKLSNYYEIIIFTASSPNYANVIVNFLDPQGLYIAAILSRPHCSKTKNGFFIKDLRILKNKSLKEILLVDNLSHSFGFQITNGVPILSWKNDKKDKELKYLSDLLIEASFYDDVRVWTAEKLKLMELSDFPLCEEDLSPKSI